MLAKCNVSALYRSIFDSIYSLKYAPPEVVSFVGQLQPLVNGRAGLPRHSPPPPLGSGGGGTNRSTASRSSNTGHDSELALLQQRRLSHSLASTSTSASTSTNTTTCTNINTANLDIPTSSWNLDPGCSTGTVNTALGETVTDAAAAAATAAAVWTRPYRSALLRSSRQLTPAQAAVQLLRIADMDVRAPSPKELLAAGLDLLDHWALREALDVLQPRLQQLSVTQLQRCLETLAVVRHPPTDPWFHEWLLASERQLEAADATEVYGMLVAMRALRQRPQSQEWIEGAMRALLGHLPQLDAVQVVELLGCFVDLALRPPERLLNHIFALLLPDLPQLQPGVVLDLLSSCTRLRVAPPPHALSAALGVLTPSVLAAAPPAALCRLAAALAALRLQLQPALLAALIGRADVLLRSAVATAAAPAGAGGSGRVAATRDRGSSSGGTAAASAAASAAAQPLGSSIASDFPPAAVGVAAAAASGEVLADGKDGAARRPVDASTRILRPRRVKARRTSSVVSAAAAAAATAVPLPSAVAAEGPVAQVHSGDGGDDEDTTLLLTAEVAAAAAPPPGTSTAQPVDSATLTGPQFSRLLRDLRALEAPLPPYWGDLCGHVLVSLTTDVSSMPVVEVSYLMRTAARCGLTLPLGAVRVAAAGLETSLRASAEARRRRLVRQRQGMMRGKAAAAGAEEYVAEFAPGLENDGDGDLGYIAMAGDTTGDGSSAAAACEGDGHDRSGHEGCGGDDNDGEGEALSRGVAASGYCVQPWTAKALSITTTALVPYAAHLPPSLLHALYDNLYDNLERFDLPELTATLHALPLLLVAAAPSPGQTRLPRGAAATGMSTPPPPRPPPALVMSYLSCLYGRMHRMQPWQLSMCIFSLLRLGGRPEPLWMDAFLGQVYRKLPYMNEVQIATVPWVVAKMSYRPQAGWVDRVLSAAAGRLSCFSPRHLSQLVWAVAVMGYRPGSEWMVRWLDKARAHFRTSDGRTLATLAWAVASVGHRPEGEWLQELCEHLARRLPYTSPRAVSNTLAALAALGHRPDASWVNAVAEHVQLRLPPPAGGAAGGGTGGGSPAASYTAEGSGCYSLQDLSHVCYSLARLGYIPSGGWLDAVSNAAARLALQDPATAAAAVPAAAAAAAHAKHIALLMLALSRHRRRPPAAAWSDLLEGLYPCLPHASPQALAVLLSAAAALQLPLPREHAGGLLLATHRRMAFFSNRGLAMVFRGFVGLGKDPGAKWLGRLEEVLRQRALAAQQQQEEEQFVAQQQRQHSRLRPGDQQQQGRAVVKNADEEEKEEEWEEGRGAQEEEEEHQQQQQEEGLRGFGGLAPRERVCMLWAAVTLETMEICPAAGQGGDSNNNESGRAYRRLRGGDREPPRAPSSSSPLPLLHTLSRHRQQQHQQQQHQQQPSSSAAFVASAVSGGGGDGGGDGGYPAPPPPRWVRKPGPLQRPLRLEGLLTLLLPPPELRQEPTAAEGRPAVQQRRRWRHRRRRDPDGHGQRRSGSGGGGGERQHPWSPLSAYTSQDLAVICWALGRLRLNPRGGGLLAALMTEVSYRLTRDPGAGAAAGGKVSAPEAAAAAEAEEAEAVTAGRKSRTAHGAVRRHGGGRRALAPSDFALACWGLSSVGMWPTASWQAVVAAAALRFAREGRLSPRDFATVLAALARWRRKPRVRPALLRRLRLGPPPGRRPRAVDGKAGSPAAEPPQSTLTLAHTSAADSADASAASSRGGFSSMSTVAAQADGDRRLLPQRCYDARSLASLTWALASLGVARRRLPVAWLPPTYRVTLLDSLSRLGLRPGAGWLEQAEQVVLQGGQLTLASSYRGLEAALRRMADGAGGPLGSRGGGRGGGGLDCKPRTKT
ncbi:hypothetical protein VOLCADRAFT_97291 [Volvox carteri f. nagariensis]|uniref:RAP domain-containing protein n=1 Tax=Volvox carteri f. nagariensis TaxID=3068 RepID=D8UCD7_VOLCA|nr:uncharacterized protein VOLCADRAFT_97291 [Volvox carteri f. nagariensis]EFJ42679.1 hypothetical protein VOLCADRAFT_97291 [Volvox carteri f. nagariensis]|eukprot:XP_002956330.1 hypothetical protein VOLCADRAFT_97291 [Volvox carteri f. nagariensis]